jgi:thiol-disulfide isomerase/thioredoxin
MKLMRAAVGGFLLVSLCQYEAARADSDQPEDLIHKMCDFYQQQKSFSVSADAQGQVHGTGANSTTKFGFNVLYEGPNHLAYRGRGGSGTMIVCDGKTLFMFVTLLKKYSTADAPKTLGQLAEDPVMSFGAPGSSNFVIDFLADDPAKVILKGVTASKDLGAAKVNKQSARHLKFTRADVDWEVWISDGKDPLLLRADFDLSRTLKKAGGKEAKVTLSQNFRNWKFGVTPGPKDFAFTVPKNAKKVQSLFGHGPEEEELPALLGKAAPPVTLERLDGKRLKLADHAGKDVVMLDIWATWCGPCRKELPELIEVAKDYDSKGVVFYAINLRESKKKIEEFLKKQNLEMTIGLDLKGKVAGAYGVEGIPMLLLVDKQGIVQAVHIGYRSDIKAILHQELDGILAGKNLAAATIADHNARLKAAEKVQDKLKNDKDKKTSNEQTAR